MVMAVIVVFVTTYMLILPAITLDKEAAESQGGIEMEEPASAVEGTEPAVEESESAVEEVELSEEEPAPEEEEAAPLVLRDNGKDYNIEVAYGEEATIPEGAQLYVKEINDTSDEYAELIARTEESIGEGRTISFARFFDIKILDKEGEKVTIQAPVDVKIELPDKEKSKEAADNTQVVHFADGEDEGEVVENVEVDGDAVSFSAEGFSEYAIVQGPDADSIHWNKVTNVSELTSQGYCIGHIAGYYLTDGITKINNSRTGITKTTPAQANHPPADAVLYYFEPAGGDGQFRIYCMQGEQKKYVIQTTNSLNFTENAANASVFTVEAFPGEENAFRIKGSNGYYWNMQGGANGKSFAAYNAADDPNARLYIWYEEEITGDPYELDGKSYGLMNWNGGAAGKAMMAEVHDGTLEASQLTVMSDKTDESDAGKLFVPKGSDISMWTFEWDGGNHYYLKSDTGGSTAYLKIDGSGDLSLAYDKSDASRIQVVPGEGSHKGQICLKANGKTLTYSGNIDTGFNTGASAGSEWLYLTEESELTDDYFMTYSAQKVSVSDPALNNDSKLIVYTRAWDDTKKKYEYFAINHDGSLVPCTETGDHIEWNGTLLNTMLWDFEEKTDAGTGEPNGFYALYNQYSGQYLAPQVTDGQTLSTDDIGINLVGRTSGKYYTPILAWDEDNYAYAGLKVENGKIVSCPKSEAMDFYFATVEDIEADDTLHTVPTLDNHQYGITMKIKDFNTRAEMSNFLGNNDGGAVLYTQPGLLSTDLKEDGYPTAKAGSLKNLFNGEKEVNHLFIESIHSASGYYVFDSSQNYATLKGKKEGDFTVYKELATHDDGDPRPSLKHGQFYPFNDIEPGKFAVKNNKNLYTATQEPLSPNDPRRNEQLYLLENPNYYYGVELEASFIQTPNGLDAWGHDIIYEFTGDDDFWLYVDGELVIDLGGIHSALPGSVNFRSGDVIVNGTHTTLKDLFYNNYLGRGHTAAQAEAYVNDLFVQIDDPDDPNYGKWVFKSNTPHTMKIFYMERGAGAANLYMRFNLASVKPGTVQLKKELSGIDTSETVLAEFPYQIKYTIKDEFGNVVKDPDTGKPVEYYLTNKSPGEQGGKNHVFYQDTITPVKFKKSLTVHGMNGNSNHSVEYNDVFMLKPNEVAEIDFTTIDFKPPEFPAGCTLNEYSIVECGVNKKVYENVYINDDPSADHGQHVMAHHWDHETGYATTETRPTVKYTNEVDKKAIRTLTFKKRLFEPEGTTEITDDTTVFPFRLYLGTEYDDELPLANLHSYHVKNPGGEYCRWNSANQKFESIGESNYADLTAAQKEAVTFTTSMYGSISKIPVDYTVEVRNVLAGTQFKVQERPAEIPDGYSFQRYLYNHHSYYNAEEGVTDVTKDNHDPHVDVCNIKGWGLRVNKKWSDQDYMSNRAPTYFAVFTKAADDSDGSGDLTLVSGTVRQMAYSDDPSTQTEYWYFDTLPVTGTTIDDYVIREVTLTSDNPAVDENGVVTNYGDAVPIPEEGEFSLTGRQKGETGDATFPYTVLYKIGTVSENSNVRVDSTTNNRPGIVLKKTKWDGTTALKDATFTLKRDDSEIGTFTSDEDGKITVAFLSDGVDYTLTETKTPQKYHGLEAPMTLTLSNGTVSVSGVSEDWYTIDQGEGKTPTVTIKDRPYTFRVIKKDRRTNEPLKDVEFALYQQKIVEGQPGFVRMTGYESLITGIDGVLPKIDNTLPPGTYQLRELQAKDGYEPLPSYIYFTVSATGKITLGDHPDGVNLKDEPLQNGTLPYELEVLNSGPKTVRIMKVDIGNTSKPLPGAKFDLYKVENGSRVTPALYRNFTSGADGTIVNSAVPTGQLHLPAGTYHLVETAPPDGYEKKEEAVVITVSRDVDTQSVAFDTGTILKGVSYDEKTSLSASGKGRSYDADTNIYTLKVSDTSGAALPSTGGAGTMILYIIGAALMVFAGAGLILRRRQM